MKRKLWIALAAVLTISLLLAGCGVSAANAETATDETAQYGQNTVANDAAQYGLGAANDAVQHYASKASAKNAIESIKKNGPDAEIDDQTD